MDESQVKITVLTSDKHMWLLKGFSWAFNKYMTDHDALFTVEVAGFTLPNFALPPNFGFISVGEFCDYPVNHWSDALIKYLFHLKDNYVLLMLEDYWLMRQVDVQAVAMAYWIIQHNPDVLKFDLSSDRLYSNPITDLMSCGHWDIIESHDKEYCLSFQASIWNRNLLMEYLVEDESPWQAELNGTARFVNAGYKYRILGFRQWPMRYQIVMNKGQLDKSGAWMFPPRHLSNADWKYIEEKGYDKP